MTPSESIPTTVDACVGMSTGAEALATGCAAGDMASFIFRLISADNCDIIEDIIELTTRVAADGFLCVTRFMFSIIPHDE